MVDCNKSIMRSVGFLNNSKDKLRNPAMGELLICGNNVQMKAYAYVS